MCVGILLRWRSYVFFLSSCSARGRLLLSLFLMLLLCLFLRRLRFSAACPALPLGGYATFLAPVACPAPAVELCCWVCGVLGASLGFLPGVVLSQPQKIGVLFRCKQYFNAAQLFKLYTGFIRPCLEYCSHIWGFSPYTSLLDRLESKAIRLIGDPSLTSTLDPLSLRRKVASLSLFYRYYFGHCSDELAACIPPPMARPRSATSGNICPQLLCGTLQCEN